MKERINKLARGIVDLDFPELKFSDSSFTGTVNAGEVSKFDIILTSENGIQLKGLIYSDQPRITVLKTAFGGNRTRINCEVNTIGLKEQDEVKGELCVVSNAGELKLPYDFRVRSYASGKLMTGLRSGEDFAALFRNEEELSLRVFDYDDFEQCDFVQDPRIMTIYRGLRKGHDRRIALIEFLKALGVSADSHAVDAQSVIEVRYAKTVRSEELRQQTIEHDFSAYVEALEDTELIEKAAELYIRNGATGEDAFKMYQKAILQKSRITRLYDYLIYAMPAGYHEELPREVYLYFAYDEDLREALKLPLYYNILWNFAPGSDIYQRFERRIQDYAIAKLLDSEINEELSFIYDHMILEDCIDEHIATVFPAILHSYRVSVKDGRMQKVIVRYEELNQEDEVSIRDGVAYVPLFFENSVLLFQDVYGNRYTDVPYEKEEIMHKPELLEKCFAVLPDHPMLKFARGREIIREGIHGIEQLRLIEEIDREMNISELYHQKLVEAVLKYHDENTRDTDERINEMDIRFLMDLDVQKLNVEEQQCLLRTMIRLNEFKEAFHVMLSTGCTDLEKPYLEKLVRNLIGISMENGQSELMNLSLQLFRMGTKDKEILCYLMEHFNGLSRDMREILNRGVEVKADARNMAERLLAQMLFTRADEGMDEVFRLYRKSGDPEKTLVRAYITKRAIDYFIDDKKIDKTVFDDLYQIIKQETFRERVPLIYLLAWSRHMTERRTMGGEEKAILQDVCDILISHRMIFAYTRKLKSFVSLPELITDKYYIEYHGTKDTRPSLYMRILPDEQDFQEVEIDRVFQNVYVRPLTLFANERAEYQIFDSSVSEDCVKSGMITAENTGSRMGDTYGILNEMSALIGTDNDRELKKAMLRYVKNEAIIDQLFGAEMKDAR